MKRTLFLVVLLLAILAGTGCKSAEEKFCGKMIELYGDDMKDCEKDALPEIKKQCENADEVFQCVVDAADKKAGDECSKKCKRKKKE